MAHLKIYNKIITTPIEDILKTAQKELTNGKLHDINTSDKGNVLISCPCHKGGQERHASCRVSTSTETDLEPGTAHCFSCGYAAHLPQLINDLFDETGDFGAEWLVERFGDIFLDSQILLPEISLNTSRSLTIPQILPEESLIPFDYYHPYMWTRKLTKEVVDEFRVGYDKFRNAITFPVYDEKHRLVMVTARSVVTKHFWIPEDVEKPVYLLYDILDRNVKTVFVCESQINTLTMRTWGYDSIGLFGTGSATQLETLKNSGVRNFVLCFDGDEAGRKGAQRFIRKMGKSCFITDVVLPFGKDINDLTKDQFEHYWKHS